MKRLLSILFVCGLIAYASDDSADRRPPSDCVFLSTFNRGDASDRSYLGLAGTLNGNAVITTRTLVLDGSGDYAEWADNAAHRAYPITYMCWFNMQGRDQAVGVLFGKYAVAGASNGYLIYTTSTEQIFSFYGNGVSNWIPDSFFVSPSSYKTAGWHHVAVVIDASGGNMYIDGASKDTNTWTGTPQATTSTATLKAGLWNGNYFNGDLDGCRIYNRALTANEIASIFSEGR